MTTQTNYDFTNAFDTLITPAKTTKSKTTIISVKPKSTKKKTPTKKTTSKPKNTNTQKPKKNKQNTNTNTQTSNNMTKLNQPKNPNQLTPKEVSQVATTTNTPPIKTKSKAQADKDFTKNMLLSNKNQRIDLFKGVLESINEEKEDNNKPILSLQRFTSMTNNLMKIFNDSQYLIMDNDTIYSLLTEKMDMIMNTIKDKSINTQRKTITDIITILNSNDNTQLKDIKKYEYYRKSIQLKPQPTQS
tara:strand:+ start:1305 stop:2039 length:735 start_codon:yes stop_codon:yes gene_type:complete